MPVEEVEIRAFCNAKVIKHWIVESSEMNQTIASASLPVEGG
jgi:hypothetical protein